jgi:DNA-binding response OmpR family regulator/class 3 adenylate cyclase/tetratricopeptide (TPR) repeat protein
MRLDGTSIPLPSFSGVTMMRSRILIVGRDVQLRARLARPLSSAGYSIQIAESLGHARRTGLKGIALTIIAAADPESQPSALADSLRAATGKMVLVVGSGSWLEAVPEAIDVSDETEIFAQVTRALAPAAETDEVAPLLLFADYGLDLGRQSLVTEAGKEILLTHSEYRLLHEFVRRPGRVLSRNQLLQAVSSREAEAYDRGIDMLVVRLRRKIEPDPKNPSLIVAVPGRGYKFAANVKLQTTLAEEDKAAPSSRHQPGHRRQVTVLSGELLAAVGDALPEDPEELRALVETFRRLAHGVCERFGGSMGQCARREVTIFFGYPLALEDAAERAIAAGLALATGPLHGDAIPETAMAAAIGIATGLVMVDPRGELIGQVLSEAALLRGSAKLGQVITSVSTRRLAGGQFAYRDRGPLLPRGAGGAVRAVQVLGPAGSGSRFDARQEEGEAIPLVGREEELDLLTRRWRQARSGAGRLVLLTGEPGIGKSRLARALQDETARDSHSSIDYFCSPRHAASALYPVRTQLEQAAGFAREDDPSTKLAKLEGFFNPIVPSAEELALIAELFSIPIDRGPRPEIAARQKKAMILDLLLRQIANLAERRSLVILFEDLQWIDPTSLELLTLLVQRIVRFPALLVATARPEFVAPWFGEAHTTIVTLPCLSQSETEVLVREVAGWRPLPEGLMEQIVDRAGGVPLFAEELTSAMFERGPESRSAAGPGIPTTLQALLAARLDRLGLAARQAAQAGAAIGREFSHELISAALRTSDPEQELAELLASGLVFSRAAPHAVYRFKHALIQDAAYHSLLQADRRGLHERIIAALEEQDGEAAQTEPQVFAHHSTEAGLTENALSWWLRAGRRAVSMSADAEAITHLKRGLSILESIEDADCRTKWDLELNLALVTPVISAYGYTSAEFEGVLDHVLELSGSAAVTRAVFPALYGRVSFEAATGFIDKALVHAREALGLARQLSDGEGTAIQRHSLGSLLLYRGRPRSAMRILEGVLPELEHDRYRSSAFEYGQDHYALISSYLSLAMWVLGRIEEARRYRERALERAEALRHLNTSCIVQAFAGGMFGALCREPHSIKQAATALLDMAAEHKLPVWLPTGTILLGQALAEDGHVHEGLEKMRAGAAGLKAIHIWFLQPVFTSWIATACLSCGLADEGQAALEDGWTVSKGGEQWMDAELHRLQGELLLVRSGSQHDHVERHFFSALEISRKQCASALELRAATSLARLWKAQGHDARASALLTSVCGKFPEGAHTKDLETARGLLEPPPVVRARGGCP